MGSLGAPPDHLTSFLASCGNHSQLGPDVISVSPKACFISPSPHYCSSHLHLAKSPPLETIQLCHRPTHPSPSLNCLTSEQEWKIWRIGKTTFRWPISVLISLLEGAEDHSHLACVCLPRREDNHKATWGLLPDTRGGVRRQIAVHTDEHMTHSRSKSTEHQAAWTQRMKLGSAKSRFPATSLLPKRLWWQTPLCWEHLSEVPRRSGQSGAR